MNNLPKHYRTFFFSDIEGSTKLIKRLGGDYAALLGRYHRAIRQALEQFDGEEVDTAGDGFFATFERPGEAVRTAAQVQRAFHSEYWAKEVNLRVRIGLHSGEAIATPDGYTGLDVHRAARVCSAAHGGQVLLSETTRALLGDDLPAGASIRELGSFLLKDFERSEKLFQLVIKGIPGSFPPPRTSIPTHTVAVLPFTNLSGDPAQEYFCEGIAQELIIALGKLPGLNVVSRSASFALEGEELEVREIAERLQATAILEGSVRKRDGQLRILVELVNAETGINLWSGRFDRPLKDVFSIEDEIAEQVARALRVKLVHPHEGAIQQMHSSNVTAYDYYLRGRRFYYQFSHKSVEFAIQMYRKAIEEDEDYALAYAGLADALAYRYLYVESSEENLQAAGTASRRAIELDPLLAEAYASRGLVLALQKRHPESEAMFERAIELDPQLFEAWYQYGRTTFVQGKLAKAAHLFETANEVRPEDYQSILLAGQIYHDMGLKKEALEARRRGVAIAEKHLQLNPGDTRALYMGANGLVNIGETTKGLDWLSRALTIEPADPMLLYNAGCIYALVGMTDTALDCLERSVAAGLTERGWFENDSNLDKVRPHPRFQALLRLMPEE